MQVNTNYSEAVLALEGTKEVKFNASSSKSREEIQVSQQIADTLSFANNNNASVGKTGDYVSIDSPEEARRDLDALNAADEIQRDNLTMKILAQANASADKYLQLLMQSMTV